MIRLYKKQTNYCLFRSSAQEQFISDSVILGMSKNLGEPAVNWTRSYALSYDQYVYLSRSMPKATKWHERPAKTQINLGIRPV